MNNITEKDLFEKVDIIVDAINYFKEKKARYYEERTTDSLFKLNDSRNKLYDLLKEFQSASLFNFQCERDYLKVLFGNLIVISWGIISNKANLDSAIIHIKDATYDNIACGHAEVIKESLNMIDDEIDSLLVICKEIEDFKNETKIK